MIFKLAICVLVLCGTFACEQRKSRLSNSVQNKAPAKPFAGVVTGESRATPYQHEQGGQGTCGPFADFGPAEKWAGASEKFLKDKFGGFRGCTGGSADQAPDCQTAVLDAGICGAPVWVRCTDSANCSDMGWKELRIVDVCPSNRAYHDKKDPDSAGDTSCASKNVVDMDVSQLKKICAGKAPGDALYGCKNNINLEITVVKPQ